MTRECIDCTPDDDDVKVCNPFVLQDLGGFKCIAPPCDDAARCKAAACCTYKPSRFYAYGEI
jgi:hypothetical protein